MKKRRWKIALTVICVALISVAAFFLNAFLGNPVSRMLAKQSALRYIEENYPDFQLEDIGYNLKTTGYYAHVKCSDSIDSRFTIHLDMLGHLWYDTFESRVLQKGNTADRLNTEYRALVDSVLEDPQLPYQTYIGFGELLFWYDQVDDAVKEYPFAMPMSQLELDGSYDVSALGAEIGRLTVYVEDDTVSIEHLTETLLDLTQRFEEKDVSFYVIDLVLEHPRPEDGSPRREGRVEVKDFRYADIAAEGLIDRVTASNEAAVAYYAEQDALKAEESPIN